MKVCIDGRFLDYAGIGRFVADLWKGLRRIGTDPLVLTQETSSASWLESTPRDRPADHVEVAFRPFLPREQFSLPLLLRSQRVDVYHATNLSVPYLTTAPIVLTVHGLFPLLEPQHLRSRAAAIYNRLAFPLAVRRAKLLVAVSDFAAEHLRDLLGVPERKIRVVPLAVDSETWMPRPVDEVADALRRVGIDRPYLLYSGTAKTHKNLGVVFDALTRAPDLPPLVLAGPTLEEVEAVWPHEALRSRVVTLGRVSDEILPALYCGATALVLPSLHESVGLPVLEAMASGTPVVASTGTGLAATVGGAGRLVDPQDVEGWAGSLMALVEDSDSRSEMIRRGLEHTRDRTIDGLARAYLGIYEEAISG